jgi:glutamate dehydrogenase
MALEMGRGARRSETARAAAQERLRALLAKRSAAGDAAKVATFARLVLGKGGTYLDELAEDEVAALVTSAFAFYASPGPELRVRAVTPTYATEGWDAPVSVVETMMPDRPFVIDTIRELLRARDVPIRALVHPIIAARRDAAGRLESLAPPEADEDRESFTHIAIPRVKDGETLAALAAEVEEALADVRLVTDDFAPMVARAQRTATELDAVGRDRPGVAGAEAAAIADFLRWLVDGAFVFLGYREYAIAPSPEPTIAVAAGSGLGVLRREERSAVIAPRPVAALLPAARARLASPRGLSVRKTAAQATVHRRAPMDDVVVKVFDAEGRVVGARRFLGLFTSKAYAEEAAEIPLLRRVLRQILAAEQVVAGSHDFKEIVAVFNALPKSVLFATAPADLRVLIHAVRAATRDGAPVVAVRPQAEGEATTVLVVLSPERFSGEAREGIRDAFARRLGHAPVDDQLVLGEDERAILAFTFPVGELPPGLEEELSAAVAGLVRTWDEGLREALLERAGEGEGNALAATWAPAIPDEYKAAVTPARAAADVELLDAVAGDGATRVVLEAGAGADTSALRLYLAGRPLVLSDVMPLLEHLGLRALAEDQVTVAPSHGPPLFVQRFVVQDRQGRPLADAAGPRLVDALLAVVGGRVESDDLNALVVDAALEWRAVDALRAYAGYGAQAGLAPKAMIVATLASHPEPARLLYGCFAARFGGRADATPGDAAAVRREFVASLESVQSLRQDLLLRALLDVVEATVRTSFFTRDDDVDRLSLKIRSADLGHLPKPRPLYEIFVHSPRMEGIHLRGGKVARGGIRYSDRPDDFRTEILGLMKTQTVKNAVIVPVGAKGGFVLKGRPGGTAVVDAYRTLIRGLLDLTDDLVGGHVVHPRDLVVHDEEDPYLVVAADKGTAAFSDVANAIAEEYRFWLGDAFASGGSHGYDHKALGITARGAWECVRTHFADLGIDVDAAPLTMVGIGDPSGDVFGNASLRSPQVRLVAAFNHRHVFLDPDPDPARTFVERERLFRAGEGWDVFDPALLSRGGMVIERAAKRVALSPEARALLGLAAAEASGEDVVRAVLRLDCDLLFNGGIGTYVRAENESDAEIRDTVNDPVRVTASSLRARVVAEGGNLGFTQRARIEYALRGGRINTDAIDNSAGVDMSDHEVNLKIALQGEVHRGALSMDARNALLDAVTDDVAAAVLAHNRAQSRLLGLDQTRSRTRLADYRELMGELERAGGLDRTLEALPDRDALRARRGTFLGLTRPELAVIVAHTKIQLARELVATPLVDDPLVEPLLVAYFPAVVVERHSGAVRAHPLRREIVASRIANALVDALGSAFVHRVTRDMGASIADAVRAWAIAWHLADGAGLSSRIDGGRFGTDLDAACRLVLERALERLTKWIVANTDPARPAGAVAAELESRLAGLRGRLPSFVVGAEAEAYHRVRSELAIAGAPDALADELAGAEWLVAALDVGTIAAESGVAPDAAAAAYFALADDVDFAWLGARLGEAGDEDRWQRRAVEGMVEDLLCARRRLARRRLESGADGGRGLGKVRDLLRDLKAAPRTSLAALHVVVRELGRL